MLSAKCGIERLSGAASHQSSTNYWSGIPAPLKRSEVRCGVGGWKVKRRILGSYQFKLSPPHLHSTLHMRKHDSFTPSLRFSTALQCRSFFLDTIYVRLTKALHKYCGYSFKEVNINCWIVTEHGK